MNFYCTDQETRKKIKTKFFSVKLFVFKKLNFKEKVKKKFILHTTQCKLLTIVTRYSDFFCIPREFFTTVTIPDLFSANCGLLILFSRISGLSNVLAFIYYYTTRKCTYDPKLASCYGQFLLVTVFWYIFILQLSTSPLAFFF